jgi:hypothetical protein
MTTKLESVITELFLIVAYFLVFRLLTRDSGAVEYGNNVTLFKDHVTVYDPVKRIFASQFKPDKMLNRTKYLGVFMDHTRANLTKLENGIIEKKKITSAFNHQVRDFIINH